MFTQLSLFDSVPAFDTVARTATVAVPPSAEVVAYEARQVARRAEAARLEAARLEATRLEATRAEAVRLEAERIDLASQRQSDQVRPMGELAQLVLARYDLMIRRREEAERRRREQPRPSIRVMSPTVAQPVVARPTVDSKRARGPRRQVGCGK